MPNVSIHQKRTEQLKTGQQLQHYSCKNLVTDALVKINFILFDLMSVYSLYIHIYKTKFPKLV